MASTRRSWTAPSSSAELRNSRRRRDIRIGTIDALLSELCIRHELTMLTTDADFGRIAKLHPLTAWRPA